MLKTKEEIIKIAEARAKTEAENYRGLAPDNIVGLFEKSLALLLLYREAHLGGQQHTFDRLCPTHKATHALPVDAL